MTSGSHLVLLSWSCELVRHVYSSVDLCSDAQWNRVVAVQCLALYGALSAGKACVCAAARKKLHRVWREVHQLETGFSQKGVQPISMGGDTLYNGLYCEALPEMENLIQAGGI